MPGKAVVSLTTGLEDRSRWRFLVAVGAAESGRPTLMFLTKEAVRLALDGVAVGVACEGCPPLATLLDRYAAAGGRYFVYPICFERLDKDVAPHPRSRWPTRWAWCSPSSNCKPRWRERLPAIEIPKLVVHGRRDPFFAVGNGEAIARAIPGSRLLVLEEAATAIPDAAADELAETKRSRVETARTAREWHSRSSGHATEAGRRAHRSRVPQLSAPRRLGVPFERRVRSEVGVPNAAGKRY